MAHGVKLMRMMTFSAARAKPDVRQAASAIAALDQINLATGRMIRSC
jgi:hypothetical protein